MDAQAERILQLNGYSVFFIMSIEAVCLVSHRIHVQIHPSVISFAHISWFDVQPT